MSVVKVTAWQVVCDRCGEHDGHWHTDPYGFTTEESLEPGWVMLSDGAVRCNACEDEARQLGCAASTGHEWDSPTNRHLATIWAGDPEFILRHCAHGCGRTEMRLRDGDWYGFDRYGWLGDPDNIRATRQEERDRVSKVRKEVD